MWDTGSIQASKLLTQRDPGSWTEYSPAIVNLPSQKKEVETTQRKGGEYKLKGVSALFKSYLPSVTFADPG